MRRSRRIAALSSAVALVAALAAACVPPANPPIDSGTIASTVPISGTPSFTGPTPPPGGFGTFVDTVAQVGNTMVAGGTFTEVNGASRPFLAAWGAPNGAISDALPATTVNGQVFAIEPTPGRTGFYVAGKFTTANGVHTSVALYSLALKKMITTFQPVIADGTITSMALVGSHLLLGGYFSHIDGTPNLRYGLASVNAATGALDNFLNIHLAGHHNYNSVQHGTVPGAVGATSMSVSPDGSTLMVIGNFTNVYDSVNPKVGYLRDQIVKIRLWTSVATVDPTWRTLTFSNRCDGSAFDSYVSQVEYSPDGSFFIVVDAGGYTGGSFQACDSAVRFNSSQSGQAVPPIWTQFTGKDSLYAVAVTRAAVYVGGHQRWFNNPYGNDAAANGAVPRPGIAALDPANGEPLAWNPGRNPRGHGTEVMYGTNTGLWVGSDTNCIGPGSGDTCNPPAYPRDQLAFFPYAGGTTPAGNYTGTATKIFKAGSFTGSNAVSLSNFNPANGAGGPVTGANGGGITWSQVRGAFYLNGRIYYGKTDGNFYYRTFSLANGGTYGPETLIDPYNDPAWDTVLTGSPTGSTNTYRGVPSSFYGNQIKSVTGMFFANRSIYYTLAGDKRLFRRAFSPGTASSSVSGQDTGGVVSPIQITVVDVNGLMNFSNAGGMWLANGRLYVASRNGGALYSMGWSGTTVSTRPVRDGAAAGSWTGSAVFVAQ